MGSTSLHNLKRFSNRPRISYYKTHKTYFCSQNCTIINRTLCFIIKIDAAHDKPCSPNAARSFRMVVNPLPGSVTRLGKDFFLRFYAFFTNRANNARYVSPCSGTAVVSRDKVFFNGHGCVKMVWHFISFRAKRYFRRYYSKKIPKNPKATGVNTVQKNRISYTANVLFRYVFFFSFIFENWISPPKIRFLRR